LPLQGPGGDTKIRYLATDAGTFRDGTWADIERAGADIAEAVCRLVQAGLRPAVPRLAACLADVELPLQPPPARRDFERVAGDPDATESTRRWAQDMLRTIDARGALPRVAAVGVHTVSLADGVRLVGVEGELGSELGELIVRAGGPGTTFALGYTNGSRLNIPCDRQLPEGGYGVDTYWEYHWPSRLAPGIDAALQRAVCSP
jgi:hypothetical protein